MSDNEEQRLAQQKAGLAGHPRGQRMGRGGEESDAPTERDENRYEMEEITHAAATPATSGDRPASSDFYADTSAQHFGGDMVTPDHVAPSTPAAIPSDQKLGASGGEAQFKQRQGRE